MASNAVRGPGGLERAQEQSPVSSQPYSGKHRLLVKGRRHGQDRQHSLGSGGREAGGAGANESIDSLSTQQAACAHSSLGAPGTRKAQAHSCT